MCLSLSWNCTRSLIPTVLTFEIFFSILRFLPRVISFCLTACRSRCSRTSYVSISPYKLSRHGSVRTSVQFSVTDIVFIGEYLFVKGIVSIGEYFSKQMGRVANVQNNFFFFFFHTTHQSTCPKQFLNDIFLLNDLSTTLLSGRVPVDSVSKTTIQG